MKTKYWYAAYTKPRAEKKTASMLEKNGVEVYLPLQRTLCQWSDRKKWVDMPLIRSYVFIKSNLSDYIEILNTPGVVKIVGFEGKPAVIPEQQINILKNIISENIAADVLTENIPEGSPVEIVRGALMGLKGELIRHKGKNKIIIRLDSINTSIYINIPISCIKKIKQQNQ